MAQDSDQLWTLTPPARRALESLLANDSSAAITFGWSVTRNAPPPSTHGGPLCHDARSVALSARSRAQLLQVIQVHAALFWSKTLTVRPLSCGSYPNPSHALWFALPARCFFQQPIVIKVMFAALALASGTDTPIVRSLNCMILTLNPDIDLMSRHQLRRVDIKPQL